MGTIKSHRDLEAWHVAMDVVTEIYRVSAAFPPKETYGLQAQVRRAAVSVPSNIAEGQARPIGAAVNHLSIAIGSLAEVDTQIEVAIRLEYLTEAAVTKLRQLLDSAGRLTGGLRRAKRLRLAGTAARSASLCLMVVYYWSQILS